MNGLTKVFYKAKTMKNLLLVLLLFSGISLNSCRDEFDILISEGDPISLSVSDTELMLYQKSSGSTALSFSWTRGSNKGTGSSISYILEIDQQRIVKSIKKGIKNSRPAVTYVCFEYKVMTK